MSVSPVRAGVRNCFYFICYLFIFSYRAQGEGVSDSSSPYKRPRTQSPSLMSNPGSTNPGQATHYAFSQEAPRYAMAVASSPYDALYRAQAYQVCVYC